MTAAIITLIRNMGDFMANIAYFKHGCNPTLGHANFDRLVRAGNHTEVDLHEIVETENFGKLKDLDYIVLDFCASSGDNYEYSLKEIEAVYDKLTTYGVKCLVVGCITRLPLALERLTKSCPDLIIIDSRDWLNDTHNHLTNSSEEFDIESQCVSRSNYPYISNVNGEAVAPKIEFNIAKGCNNNCTFCKTNFVKDSRIVSLPFNVVLNYLKDTVKINGVREISLLGDNLTQYCVDTDGKPRIHELLNELEKIPEVVSIYVSELTFQDMYSELLQELIRNKKVKFTTLQIEMASDNLLKLMNRKHTVKQADEILAELRHNRDLKIMTFLMSGFPTETEADVLATIEFIKRNDLVFGVAQTYQHSPLLKFVDTLEHLPIEEQERHLLMLNEFGLEHNTKLFRKYARNIKQALILQKYQDVTLCSTGTDGFLATTGEVDDSYKAGDIVDVEDVRVIPPETQAYEVSFGLKIC